MVLGMGVSEGLPAGEMTTWCSVMAHVSWTKRTNRFVFSVLCCVSQDEANGVRFCAFAAQATSDSEPKNACRRCRTCYRRRRRRCGRGRLLSRRGLRRCLPGGAGFLQRFKIHEREIVREDRRQLVGFGLRQIALRLD